MARARRLGQLRGERRPRHRHARMKRSLVIAIVAPSGYVADPSALDRAAAYLEAEGHRVIVDDAARLRHQRFAGTDEERLQGLHRIAARDDVDLILAARGG